MRFPAAGPPGEYPPAFPAALEPALCFKNFSFRYRAQTEPTLRDINLSVPRGEKVLILGPSGSGKSTLAYCLNGLIPHAFKGSAEGSLAVLGEDPFKLGIFALSKKVGTLLQDTDGQFVGLSAGEDIAFSAENDRMDPEEMRRRVPEAARLTGMEAYLAQSPKDLSGGQKQRVSLAGLLMDQVEILLFDEPLASLDPAAGKEAVELIHRLHGETGKTIIIVEHRLEDVLHRPLDRIVVMDEGRIIADLPPAELLASDILIKTGIREPLYLRALRSAGIPVTAASEPESAGTVRFEPRLLAAWAGGLEAEEAAPREGPPVLEAEGLCFSYPEAPVPALENLSFAIRRGESLSLVGRNGAGKSTLAKLICGFIRPGAGRLLLEGRDLGGLSIKERADFIGYVMQNPNQMISLPLVYDETALGLRSRGLPEGEIREKVHETLKVCGLYPFRGWPVNALSYGQKKRLTIAAILVLGPSLLILDEPTAGQDFRHYTEFMEFLRRLNREGGQTLLMITHDMHLMLEYSDRALVLAPAAEGGPGRFLAGGSPASILSDEALTRAAALKRTSLYDLAVRAGLEPRAFAEGFIRRDRSRREGARP
ncbi:MAG: ABC transporter ATP-binding protein [Treponema sp.]|jgi:energy-coupling factor transport system ATP-binding protein|nr:ABC transporter ATP-binding protein [Treponema sp.]